MVVFLYQFLRRITNDYIPEYQRAYSWGIENCDKLWQAINDFVKSDSKDRYFFGTIIVNCQDGDTKYVLIDGQQRTTSFLLLLKALLVRINIAIEKTSKDEDSVSLCRGLQDHRRNIMKILYMAEIEDISDKPERIRDAEICTNAVILENYSINEQYNTELSTILKAVDYEEAETSVIKIPNKRRDNRYTTFFRNYKFFCEKIRELSESQLNSITKAILEKCEVIQIKSWNVEQAITMFNSLNSDGMPLDDSDIISAKLYAAAEKKKEEQLFSDKWESLKDQIHELNQLGIADIKSILMQYMYYKRTINRDTVTKTGSIDVTTPGLRRYFTELRPEELTNPTEMCSNMLRLVKIWKKVSDYTVVKVLLKFNENVKLFLASYFYRFTEEQATEQVMTTICESMLRLFTLLELSDYGYSSKYFKTFLFGLERKLVDNNISFEEIKSDIDEHIRTNWEKEQIESAIESYDGNLLVYLNEYLVAKEEKMPFILDSKCDIEHIMPYSGKTLSNIRHDAQIDDKDEFLSVVNKLGNKILLEAKINRAIGNEWFRAKVSTYLRDKTGYIDSAYPIARKLVSAYANENKPYWTKYDIESATQQARDRIVSFIFGK